MNRKAYADLFGDGNDLAEERREIAAHVVVGDALEALDSRSYRGARLRVGAAGKSGDDVALQPADFVFAFCGDSGARRLDQPGLVVVGRACAPQHERVITDEIDHIETERQSARR